MYAKPFSACLLAVILTGLLPGESIRAQVTESPVLQINSRPGNEKEHTRATPTISQAMDSVFARLRQRPLSAATRKPVRPGSNIRSLSASSRLRPPPAPSLQSFGTGGGDINESEPNDSEAQGVSLPVNIFGRVGVDFDVDFFAFEALANQQIVVEPFAARLAGSLLIPDIALFDSTGTLLAAATGTENTDPLIRYLPSTDDVLIVGITDADDLGGRNFTYMLNIVRGDDVDEVEPNDGIAQHLAALPATIFGRIGNADVDFYGFEGTVGQTLIVDVDAEVLGSGLDAEINLRDPVSGVEYFYNDQHEGDDPRFNIVLPYTGLYVIGIGAFNQASKGFYRLNATLISSAGAPVITGITKISKKLIQVTGSNLSSGSRVELNGVARKTTLVAPGVLQAKAKAKAGGIITVTNSPDERRSNPLIVQ